MKAWAKWMELFARPARPGRAFACAQDAFNRRYAAWRAAQPVLEAKPLAYAPRISVLGPASLHNTLRAQTYPHWELTDAVQGEYVLFLRAGDVLAPDALYRFAAALNAETPRPDLLFADEDRETPQGKRDPHFKSALCRANLFSHDALGRPLLVSRAIFEQAGPLTGEDDAAGYAYALRAAALSERPRHIAGVLLSRRVPPHIDPAAGRAALDAALTLTREKGYAAAGRIENTFRAHLFAPKARVGIVIPNKNDVQSLRRLLESLERSALMPYGICIADGGTEDLLTLRYYELLQKSGAADVLHAPGASYAELCNLGARRARAELLLFLRPWVELETPGFLLPLAELALREETGAVGCALRRSDGAPEDMPLFGRDLLCALPYWAETIHAVSLLRGDCLMLRSDLFFAAGCFDESFVRAGADTELCLRLLRRGRTNVYTPYAAATVHPHETPQPTRQDQMRLFDTLRPLRAGDPCFSQCYRTVWEYRPE